MKNIIDSIIHNGTVGILFAALVIETKEIFELGDTSGRHIDVFHLFWASPLTVFLFVFSIYALAKKNHQWFNWSAMVTFLVSAIVTTIGFVDRHEPAYAFISIFCLAMVALIFKRIHGENTKTNLD